MPAPQQLKLSIVNSFDVLYRKSEVWLNFMSRRKPLHLIFKGRLDCTEKLHIDFISWITRIMSKNIVKNYFTANCLASIV